MPDIAPDKPKPKRRWLQFRLQTLFILVAVVAVPCGLFKWKWDAKQRERRAVDEIRQLGGYVNYDWQDRSPQIPSGPACIRTSLGDDFLASVWLVVLRFESVNDVGLSCLTGLAQLRFVSLQGKRGFTDVGLGHLKQLKQLESLDLTHCTGVTDAEVDEIRMDLPNCQIFR
jgi:hypothetical protein